MLQKNGRWTSYIFLQNPRSFDRALALLFASSEVDQMKGYHFTSTLRTYYLLYESLGICSSKGRMWNDQNAVLFLP